MESLSIAATLINQVCTQFVVADESTNGVVVPVMSGQLGAVLYWNSPHLGDVIVISLLVVNLLFLSVLVYSGVTTWRAGRHLAKLRKGQTGGKQATAVAMEEGEAMGGGGLPVSCEGLCGGWCEGLCGHADSKRHVCVQMTGHNNPMYQMKRASAAPKRHSHFSGGTKQQS